VAVESDRVGHIVGLGRAEEVFWLSVRGQFGKPLVEWFLTARMPARSPYEVFERERSRPRRRVEHDGLAHVLARHPDDEMGSRDLARLETTALVRREVEAALGHDRDGFACGRPCSVRVRSDRADLGVDLCTGEATCQQRSSNRRPALVRGAHNEESHGTGDGTAVYGHGRIAASAGCRPEGEQANMGILDKLKGLVGGHKKEVGEGIDKAADVAKDKIGHDKEVDKAADAAKGALGVDDKKK
jgi:hypothetical protein